MFETTKSSSFKWIVVKEGYHNQNVHFSANMLYANAETGIGLGWMVETGKLQTYWRDV